ncbi:hypothetical protein [Arthrobacter zhaoguopingii]|uniref:hypothetical protein n=1 Tax=Arthrobacter zhaoguopingii TaxID=2681491 RepID=UPI001359AF69|nr:hypothetical protein [Arthrobacter zhaoguopingii]
MRPAVLPAPRIVHRGWTETQLRAAAERHALIQRHTSYAPAAAAVASHARHIDQRRIRKMVTAATGETQGTYWMVAALTMAHLALSFPQALTEDQRALLLEPLAAAEHLAAPRSANPRAAPGRSPHPPAGGGRWMHGQVSAANGGPARDPFPRRAIAPETRPRSTSDSP